MKIFLPISFSGPESGLPINVLYVKLWNISFNSFPPGFYSCFFVVCWFFPKNFFQVNILNHDLSVKQIGSRSGLMFCRSDLDPICLQRLWVDNTSRQSKHLFGVLKRIHSLRQFFWVTITYMKFDIQLHYVIKRSGLYFFREEEKRSYSSSLSAYSCFSGSSQCRVRPGLNKMCGETLFPRNMSRYTIFWHKLWMFSYS